MPRTTMAQTQGPPPTPSCPLRAATKEALQAYVASGDPNDLPDDLTPQLELVTAAIRRSAEDMLSAARHKVTDATEKLDKKAKSFFEEGGATASGCRSSGPQLHSGAPHRPA